MMSTVSCHLDQGSPSLFLGGPFSDLGHRRRATCIIHIMKIETFREDGKMNFFNTVARKYITKYTCLKALKKTKRLKRKAHRVLQY